MSPTPIPNEVWACVAVQALWIAWGVHLFRRRNDELLLVAACFLFYCGSYRYLAAARGLFEWGGLQSFKLNVVAGFEEAARALVLLVLGQTVLSIFYSVFQPQAIALKEEPLPAQLAGRMRQGLVWLAGVSLVGTALAGAYLSRQWAGGRSAAFEISNYALQFSMILIAAGIFAILVWRFGALRGWLEKGAVLAFLAVVAYSTFGLSGRFKFLGWIIGGAYVVSSARYGLRRLPILAVGAVVGIGVFAYAGALRTQRDSAEETVTAGIQNVQRGEDANMLDGFTFLMQVYPELLPYSLGGEHLEILLRPIPRAWWPGKPVGGYMNKLGLFDADSATTTGISPSLFGSFYQEGGTVGIVLISALYGWAIAQIVRWSLRLRAVFGVMFRACLVAGCIPLLRAGDLPGNFAWLGMSFWPLALFFWWNRSWLYQPGGASGQRQPRSRRPRRRKAGKPIWARVPGVADPCPVADLNEAGGKRGSEDPNHGSRV